LRALQVLGSLSLPLPHALRCFLFQPLHLPPISPPTALGDVSLLVFLHHLCLSRLGPRVFSGHFRAPPLLFKPFLTPVVVKKKKKLFNPPPKKVAFPLWLRFYQLLVSVFSFFSQVNCRYCQVSILEVPL